MATQHNFRIKNGLEVGGVLIVNSSGQLQAASISGAISATSIGVTNIVTNKVVKFNGTILDDSNITDTGSLITLGSNTTLSGTLNINHSSSLSGTQVYIKKLDGSTNLQRWGEGTSGASTYRFRIDQGFKFIANSGSPAVDTFTLFSDTGNVVTDGTISSGAITATTVNTGQGATEVHLMNQNVRSTDSVIFDRVTVDPASGGANFSLDRSSTSVHNNLLFYTGSTLYWRLWQSGANNSFAIRNEATTTNVLSFTDNESTFSHNINAPSLNTGHGDNELYPMNQAVRTSDSPTFQDLTVQGNLSITGDINSYNVTDLDVTDKTITVGAGQTEANSGGSGLIIDGSAASMLWDEGDNRFEFNKNVYAPVIYGSGAGITALNASNLSSGTVAEARLPTQTKYLRSDAADSGGTTIANALTLNYIANTRLLVGASSFTDVINNSPWYGLGRTTLAGYHSNNATMSQLANYWGLRLQTATARMDMTPTGYQGNILFGAGTDVSGTTWARINSTGLYQGLSNLVWHAGNDGSGSTLDADLLDGIHASSFVRSDANDTKSGNLVFQTAGAATDTTTGLQFETGGSYTDGRYRTRFRKQDVGGGIPLYIDQSGSTANSYTAQARFGTYSGNSYEFEVYGDINATGNIYDGGNAVWHAGNDGSGSTLDADTLDGVQLNRLANTRSYGTGNITYGTTDQWYSLIADFSENESPITLYLKSSAHSSCVAVISRGYHGNNVANINILASNYTQNSGYPGVSGIRVFKTTTNVYKIQIRLSFTAASVTSFGLKCKVVGGNGSYDLPTFETSLAVDTTSGTVVGTAYTNQSSNASSFSTVPYVQNNAIWHAGTLTTTNKANYDTAVTVANAALPKAGGALTGNLAGTTAAFSGKVNFQGDAAIEGAAGYGVFKGYTGNNNHFILVRGAVANSSTFSITAGHQTTFVEHAENNDTTGWFFKSNQTGSYAEIARITRTGGMHLQGNKVWHAGNDGSGSTLDADLLDGQHASAFQAAGSYLTAETLSSTNAVTVTGTKYWQPAGTATSPLGGGGSASLQAYTTGTTAAYMAFHRSGAYAINWGLDTSNTMVLGGWSSSSTAARMSIGTNGLMVTAGQGNLWGASNDGAGSGLDADLLDGQHGSYYMPASTTSITESHRVSGNAFATTSSPGSVLEYQQASGQTDTRLAPSGDWHNTIRMGHGNPYNYYSNTIAARMTGTGVGDLYTQSIHNNTANGWRKLWSTGNDGAGSGLDADLLDGQQGSYYAPATGGNYLPVNNPTATGTLVSPIIRARKSQTQGNYTTAALWTESFSSTNTGIAFHISGNVGKMLDMRTDGHLYWENGRVWSVTSDGSGSGLDADLLDGNHASAFMLAGAAPNAHVHSYLPLTGGTLTGGLQVNGALGALRSSTNGAIWFTGTVDSNHALWNDYYGGPTTRGSAGSGFDGMRWNAYRGLRLKGGSGGAYNCLIIENSSSNTNDHTVKLYASNVLRLSTTTTGVTIGGILASADHTITSGTSGTNTSGLVFKTTDNTDNQKYIKQTAYYMQYNGHNNEGHHFTAGGTNSLLRLHGSTNGTRPNSVDITADNGLYINNVQVISASRNITAVNITPSGYISQGTGQSHYFRGGTDANWRIGSDITADSGGLVNSAAIQMIVGGGASPNYGFQIFGHTTPTVPVFEVLPQASAASSITNIRGKLYINNTEVINNSRVMSPTTVNIAGTSATTKSLTVNSSHSTNAATIVVGNTVVDQTLVDGNTRPMVVIDGAYPVLNLNHTTTSNSNHGPTIQFTYEGYSTNRQVVIGTDGQGQRIDFGFSGGTSGTNSDKNPHNGISGYSGVTPMRVFPNGVLIGSTGVYPNEINGIAAGLTVQGNTKLNSTIISGLSSGSGTGCTHIEKVGGIRFGWDNGTYGVQNSHSIRSTYGDVYGDDMTINSYHHMRFNIDTNANNSDEVFQVGRHTTATANILMTLDTSGNFSTSGNITAYSSDRRLKKNFKPIENPLDKVLSLNGYNFDWRMEKLEGTTFEPEYETNDVGLIAQEVQAVCEQAAGPAPFDIQYNEKTKKHESQSGEDYLTVNYDKLVPLLVEAIKEQQNKIDKLEELINNTIKINSKEN